MLQLLGHQGSVCDTVWYVACFGASAAFLAPSTRLGLTGGCAWPPAPAARPVARGEARSGPFCSVASSFGVWRSADVVCCFAAPVVCQHNVAKRAAAAAVTLPAVLAASPAMALVSFRGKLRSMYCGVSSCL